MSLGAPVSPPPLRDGDHLTTDEFMRRWEAMPDLKHAELIDGIVYMPSPVSFSHDKHHSLLHGWVFTYTASTPGSESGLEGTWLMGPKDVPQPDIALRILPEYGGQSRLEGEYSAGAPELIVEVAMSSRSRDLGVKLRLYERMGVREYLVALVGQKKLFWYERTPAGYQVTESPDGILRSRYFHGLWLNTGALWELDQPGVLATLHQGLATPEHAAFAARLAAQKR